MRLSLFNNSKLNVQAILFGLLLLLGAGAACRTNIESGTGDSSGIVVVNAPATGEVRPLEEMENEIIRFAISHYRGQMSEVARRLKIGRSTLYRKLDEAAASDPAEGDAG